MTQYSTKWAKMRGALIRRGRLFAGWRRGDKSRIYGTPIIKRRGLDPTLFLCFPFQNMLAMPGYAASSSYCTCSCLRINVIVVIIIVIVLVGVIFFLVDVIVVT